MDGWLREYEREGVGSLALECPEYGSVFFFDDNDELCPECEAEGVER